jgi:hypothetical protein
VLLICGPASSGAQQRSSAPTQSPAPGSTQAMSEHAPLQASQPPRVFITDSNSWQMVASVGGSGGNFGGSSAGGARPQTAEVIKTFGQRCPEVIVNNRSEVSNYVVELDHEGGKGLLRHKDKIAVFERASGDSIFSESTLSVGGSVQDACRAIIKDWSDHSSKLSTPTATAVAQTQPSLPVDTATKANLSVSSNPPGADIEVDGDFIGNTPSMIQVGSGEHEIAIRKKGFQDWRKKIKVTGGNVSINADLDAVTNSASR